MAETRVHPLRNRREQPQAGMKAFGQSVHLFGMEHLSSKPMIQLTTKLTTICSLLRRVLEMEEKATPDWHYEEDDEGSSMGWIMHGNESLFDVRGDSAQQAENAELAALTRNLTKPQATALLGDIERWTATQVKIDSRMPRDGAWESECPFCLHTVPFGPVKHTMDCLSNDPASALQSIADAFPDELFQDSSRCA